MNNIKNLRLLNNLKQKDVAEYLGISQQSYSYLENSSNDIKDSDKLEKLSKLFNVSIDEINTNVPFDILKFLDDSYTCFHAVKNAEEILKNNGYKKLYTDQAWELKKGDKCYITKNDSALIAFKVGDLSNYAFNIAGSHTDSPSLRVKGDSLIDSPEGKRINVEVYGGLILYSIMDIPLKVAGKIITKKDGILYSKTYESKCNVNIPSLCFHHNNTVNDGFKFNPQVDMLPLVGNIKSIYDLFDLDGEPVDSDLFVVPNIKAYYSGINNEYLVSSRIDNLTSAFSSINALIESNPKGIALACLFDNEEIGSQTKQGAKSSLLENLLLKINYTLGYNLDDYRKALNNGFILSIDNGHAVHPAHPEKADVDQKTYMNNGVMIKHHTNYASDAVSSSIMKMIFENNKIKYQEYYNRSDLRCGGTLGLFASTNLEMNTVDIGLAQLAMHSAIETVGFSDIELMKETIKSFFNTTIEFKDETIIVK